ncbi:glycosyltransferase family 4 protein [Methylocystis sp. MJC1]|uniref:glycosyltransferase family 4 protein n=1 Tax=Methylocystis sp. MJC1 TaxID=2654282 RepID=UPI001FED557B|nr:glycosyltransferase family 4 protein [Methylocystis sp. MJC1]KAF2992257.1 GDP-mannose-dependent alpha-(1-6)-phosphatidylinositol monomannoside mannosyltransferase [Methylocystis sp. MJC1]UZX10347.1 glycosyltransferase family 4 protein [Methylocystis sp. MJC1]
MGPTQKTVAIVQTQAENAGAQEIARQLANGFETQGWRVRQIFFFRRTESFDEDPNVFFCAKERPSTPLGVLKMIGALYSEFRREKPDAVVTLQHYGNLIGAPIARLAGNSVVIANQLTPAPLVPRPVALADKFMGAVGFYDHIVVNSAQTEAEYRGYPASYAKRLTRVDHGFFDKSAKLAKSEARARLGLPQDVPLLGCAARLHHLKQVDLAIRTLVENPDQHLALAGQGQERENLEALAASLGVADRTHFLGELGTEQMGAFLASLDCFVFPSGAETFGLAPVEAAQAGVPVVVNDIEILREVLAVDGEPCAIFINAKDTKAFAEATRRLLADAELSARLTAIGRRLTERYPLHAMIEDYVRLAASA